jgi:hypothetical protein
MGQADMLEIPVTLHLSRDANARLVERAAASGKPLPEFIATLVESLVETPRSIEEISGPVYQKFLGSGTTDDQLSEELEQAKHQMRTERRARGASS